MIRIKGKLGLSNNIIKVKSNKYYPKCNNCNFTKICGEGEYLRLNVDGRLIPCMYRLNLMQNVYTSDTKEKILKKVAIGFRRIRYDNI